MTDNEKSKNKKQKTEFSFKKLLANPITKIIGIILLIAALVFGGIRVINYSKTAYLKPYIQKYNIEFPQGILKEMCDAYGEDQSIRGRLESKDLDSSINVSYIIKENTGFLENGANIEEEQHFRAIKLHDKKFDLESIYSTPEGFLASSQKLKFTTLYEEETYKVVASFYTNTKPEDDNGYLFPYNFCGNMNEKDFKAYEDRIVHRALFDTGYELTIDDYYLTVSVPSDFMQDFRFVVVCVKTDERKFTKSKKAEINEKVHYPQVWYDENNENNTYIFAGKWYPKGI